MFQKLDELVKKYNEIGEKLASPEVVADYKKGLEYNKLYSELSEIVDAYAQYKKFVKEQQELKASQESEKDHEMLSLVHDELKRLETSISEQESKLKKLLLPKNPNDEKNVIIEIRGGAGGDESAIFAADLFRMYRRYAERSGYKTEVLEVSENGVGGFKEVVFLVKGKGAYSKLKFESGVHRVQRVPKTEASGRIHTSTSTVAVLPEVEDVEINIEPRDLKIDTYRSGGCGGQSVNTTDSAVRITHLPTGLIVACQDERSQIKNRERAMKILKAKLFDFEDKKRKESIDSDRKNQIGTGERSEKIRTYNFPQSRVTDHRINVTIHQLESFMDGDIEDLIEQLSAFDETERLKSIA